MSLDLLDQIDAGLNQKKISIVEFAESSDYCGKRLYPRQKVLLKLIFLEELEGWEEDILDYWIAGGRNGTEVQISPKIRERVAYLRSINAPHFRNVILNGGRRSSKGFVTGIALSYVMWNALQLQDPGQYYGIDKEKEIYFSCVASAQDQAKKFQYADFVSTIENNKAFEEYISKSLETEFGVMTPADMRKFAAMKKRNSKVQRHVAKLRGNALASNASTLRGSATMALVIDEMAHMLGGESRASGEQVYDAAEPALDQFGMDGIIFCNSSPYTKVGKFYELHEEAMTIDEQTGEPASPIMMAMRFPSWALYDGYWEDPQRRFRKAIQVSPDWDPEEKIEGKLKYSNADRASIMLARQNEKNNPDKYKVERRSLWAEIVDAYLNPERVDRMFKGRPFLEGERVTYEPFKDNLGEGALNIYRYAAHLDPSSTTAGFGFALGHIERLPDPEGVIGNHVVFDIIRRWQPHSFPGGVIDWKIVMKEVLSLAEVFYPERITFDQFQSHAPIQQLQRDLHARAISTQVKELFATNETNWNRAETFKTALYMGLVHGPWGTDDNEWASQELKFLQQINTAGRYPRVDKQDVGPVQTKDMADCVMTVTDYLIGNEVAQLQRQQLAEGPVVGAQGGYQIGGRSTSATPAELQGLYQRRTGEQRQVAGSARERASQRPRTSHRGISRGPRGF